MNGNRNRKKENRQQEEEERKKTDPQAYTSGRQTKES